MWTGNSESEDSATVTMAHQQADILDISANPRGTTAAFLTQLIFKVTHGRIKEIA